MSRSGGYKCYNIKCGSCIGKTLCGEPGESALACDNRIVTHKTNGDCIRSMSDEMRPNCDKPLTLRRLQEILESNEEIIGCPIIVSENGILSHAVLDARVDDGICAVVSANEHWLKEKDYGKTWLAYAYHPSRLDMDEWVSVKDDLPEDGEEVIAFAPKQKKTFVGYVIRGKHEYDKPITWFLCGAMRKKYTVTMSVSHWRKKPEEPK